MAMTIASLGLSVDSSEVDKGAQALHKLAQAGAKAESEVKDIGTASTQAAAKVAAVSQALNQASVTLDKTGVSAKQTAAALRTLPAQFSDIVVSLQGGQSPLSVLLQQGSQIKDSFGGIGPAAQALGGYVAGLISPLSLAAGAIGALGIAAYKASQDLTDYQKALTLTGNYAGTSANELAYMAEQISATTGTTSKAAGVLATLAASGKIARSSFVDITTAAVSMQQATGKAVEETVAEFVKLGEDPVKATQQLNEQYHYMAAAVFQQIQALQEQGDKQAAANLAEEHYASAMQKRASQIIQDLDLLDSAWLRVKKGAGEAWDAMQGLFRDASLERRISELQQAIDNYQPKSGIAGARQRSRNDMELELQFLQQQLQTRDSISRAQALDQQTQQAATAALQSLHTQYLGSLEKEARKKHELALLDEKRVNALKVSGVDRAAVEREYEVSRKAIEAKYAERETPAKAYRDDAATQMLASLSQQEASLREQLATNEKLTASERTLAQFNQQIADIKNKSILTADQKSIAANELQIRAQLEQNVALEDEIQGRADLVELERARIQILRESGQLVAATNAEFQLENAKKIAEYEKEGNKSAIERYETLRRTREAEARSRTKDGAVEGVSKAPTSGRLDASVGGASSELDRLNDEAKELDRWRRDELEKQAEFLAARAINAEQYAEREANINQQAREGQAKIEQAKNDALLTGASDFFSNMIALSQSGNKEMAAIGKAAAIAQATISTYKAATDAFAALAGIPIIGPALGAAAAGAAIAAGLANIAAIEAAGYSEGGYTGAGGKYEAAGIVHRGEIVWSQEDIRRAGGVAVVEAQRKGMRGYAEGGVVTPITNTQRWVNQPAANSAPANKGISNVQVVNNGSPVSARTEIDGETLRIILDATRKDITEKIYRGGNKLADALVARHGQRIPN